MSNQLKAIILGPPLVGKTTLMNYLRKHTTLPILELDEELVGLNNGVWPTDEEYRNKVLVHKVVDDIKNLDSVLFFTTYFGVEDLRNAKQNGFIVIQLMLNKEGLLKRNIARMQDNQVSDATKDIEENLKLQNEIKKAGVVDKTIYTNKPVEEISKEIIELLNPN